MRIRIHTEAYFSMIPLTAANFEQEYHCLRSIQVDQSIQIPLYEDDHNANAFLTKIMLHSIS